MSLLSFLLILATGTALSWTAWILVIILLSPTSGGMVALMLFYGSFFMALLGTVTIIGFFLRYWLEKEAIPFRQIAVAMRQATILSVSGTVALLLQSRRLLNLWALLIMIVLAIVIESFFLVGQTTRRTDTN